MADDVSNISENYYNIDDLLKKIPQFVSDLQKIKSNRELLNDEEKNSIIPFISSWVSHTRSLLEDKVVFQEHN
jgi:hypothetical protein